MNEQEPLSQIPPAAPRLDRVYTGGVGFELAMALLIIGVALFVMHAR